ncbi:MAG: LacI family DNA-binding transcriptional regulator [Planctomycetota bacterium]|jgi:LacI family transcriptional regulator|nr:LacI family DNA-binding transcriptional regulator [Planctomycetota bacterium]
MQRVTLQQIADATGLGKSTVGYILRGDRKRFTEESCELVLRTARQLGYRSNVAARAMSKGRFGAVALINSTGFLRSIFSPHLLTGIDASLQQAGLLLTVAALDDEHLTDRERLPSLLSDLSVDGILLNYAFHQPPGLNELLSQLGLPTVWINAKYADNAVYANDHGGAQTATERLLKLGHTRIAYCDPEIGSDDDQVFWHYSMHDREAGYRAAMTAAGLPAQVWRPKHRQPPHEWLDLCREWFANPTRPSAILCYSPRIARNLLMAASQLDIKIPQDCSLMTFAAGLVDDLQVPIDTVLIPDRAIGHAAVAMLRDQIATGTTKQVSQAITMDLAQGASCSPPTP